MSKINKKLVELKRIVLEVGDDKTIELSFDQARDLKNILKDLLGDETGKTVYIPYERYVYPEPYRVYPTWTWQPNTVYGGTVTNGTSGTITLTSSSSSSLRQ